MTRNRTDLINSLLPQTQCRECGFSGCLPYAEALDAASAAVNLCLPGGEAVMRDLAQLLGTPTQTVRPHQNALARIDEAVCIGCTACIRACPVDAIIGASKRMHTVLADECTGCGLCVPPCPVDCIIMDPVADEYLPRARFLSESDSPRFAAAEHARIRYERRQERIERQNQERKRHLAERQAAFRLPETAAAPDSAKPAAALNPAALIAQAMSRAQEQQQARSVPANRERYRQEQIQAAQKQAEYRRNMRTAQYGSGAEQAAAIEWLRRHKAEQENPPSV